MKARLNRIWIGVRAFWIGSVVFPIAAVLVFFESVFDGWMFRRTKNRLKK